MELARDELFARPGLARDEDGDVGGGDLLQLAKDFHHRRAHADDVAEALVLELRREAILVGTESVQEHRVLQDQRRLPGEDREHVELRALEEPLHAIVAAIKDARDVALRHERRADDAGELERDHALARAELRVGERVAHDERTRGLEDLAHDAVGDGAGGVGDRLALDRT